MRICFTSIDVETNPTALEEVLELFKELGIEATLFVSGEILERYPERFKKWQRDFEIASHSFSHRFWPELSEIERKKELDRFVNLYKKIFNKTPFGFRAPSHLIDEKGMKLLEKFEFLYDSSILPHYPFFKRYRGFKGKAPLLPYFPSFENCRKSGEMRILEIPTTGQIFGIPLTGIWIRKLPLFVYELLFLLHSPSFLTLLLHSFDVPNQGFLKKLKKLLKLLKKKNYQFLKGIQIYEKFSKD